MRFIFFFLALLQTSFGFCYAPFVLDDKVIQGQLENGLTYYIRENQYPKEKASLRLAVKVGSIYEKENQLGIAHFIEHLVFRGSKNFKDGEVIKYLESIGAWFGSDLNAMTTFDSTIFELDIPLDEKNSLENSLRILNDFAGYATLSSVSIQKERNVVLDELHQSQSSPNMAIIKKYFDSFLSWTPYYNRFPAGSIDIIQKVKPKVLRNFYKKWYRPDRMAVIVVGDFDAQHVESMIKARFAKLHCPKKKVIEPFIKAEYPKSSKVVIHCDADLTSTEVELLSFYPSEKLNSIDAVKQFLIYEMCVDLLKERLAKRKDDENIFLNVSAIGSPFLGSISVFSTGATLFENRIEEGLRALHEELQRVLQWGFTESELNRVKENATISFKHLFANMDKLDHHAYAGVCLNHFVQGNPLLSIEWLMEQGDKIVNSITIEDLHTFLPISPLAHEKSIFFMTPSQKICESINEKRLRQIFSEEIETSPNIEQQQIVFQGEPKFPKGEIVEIQEDTNFQTTFLTLSNGIQLVLKKTDLEKNRIHIRAQAARGLKHAREADFHSLQLAVPYLIKSGFGGLTKNQLSHLYFQNGIGTSIEVDGFGRYFAINGNQDKLETIFQLIHAFFLSPHFDVEKWDHLIDLLKEIQKQLPKDPDYQFNQFLNKINTQNHFYFQDLNLDLATEEDARRLFNLYFGRPQDFTFVIVGDFNQTEINQLIEKYLASLPEVEKKEIPFTPIPKLFPTGVIWEEFKCGGQTYATTYVTLPCNLDHQNRFENYEITALCKLLNQRIQQVLRHELGNTYGVSVWVESPFNCVDEHECLQVRFTSQPRYVENMVKKIFEEFEKLKVEPPTQKETDVINTLMTEKEKDSKLHNHYWMNKIIQSLFGKDAIETEEFQEKKPILLTAEKIQEIAKALLSSSSYTVLIHMPE